MGSKHEMIGPHFIAASYANKLRKQGHSPEHVREKVAERVALQNEWIKENKKSENAPEIESEQKDKDDTKARKSAHETFKKAKEAHKKERDEKENPPQSFLDEVRNQARVNTEHAKAKRAQQNTNFTTDTHFEQGFYGHVRPEQFRKTSIVSTTGRVR